MTITHSNKKTDRQSASAMRRKPKLHWPDLVFGPVNLWSLPPASFFYRKSG